MKQWTRFLAALLCCLLLVGCTAKPGVIDRPVQGCRQLLQIEGDLLTHTELLPPGSSQADWLAMALALGGADGGREVYLRGLEAFVTDRYAREGTLHTRKATEFHRIALTVAALGADPTAFGTHPDGSPVDLVAEGTYAYAGDLGHQGLNGLIFALITLNSGKYGTEDQRMEILSRILAAQTPEGGFGLAEGSADADITAMALQALAPYRESCPLEIEAALDWLAGQMTPRCTFLTYDSESAESVAQVIIALCCLGIDPKKDGRFLRGEQNLLLALDSFALPDGTYRHAPEDTEGNVMATEQAMLALIAADRFSGGGKTIYDFT